MLHSLAPTVFAKLLKKNGAPEGCGGGGGGSRSEYLRGERGRERGVRKGKEGEQRDMKDGMGRQGRWDEEGPGQCVENR